MLLGGAVADRIDRRRILLSSQLFQMAMALVLGGLYASGHLGIAAIVLVAFATGLMQSQSAPTYQAVITSLVPKERIANAVALNSLQFNLSRAIGPVVAGLLLAHAGAGGASPRTRCRSSGSSSPCGRSASRRPPGARESLGQSLRAGLSHVAGAPRLRAPRSSPPWRASSPSPSSPTFR